MKAADGHRYWHCFKNCTINFTVKSMHSQAHVHTCKPANARARTHTHTYFSLYPYIQIHFSCLNIGGLIYKCWRQSITWFDILKCWLYKGQSKYLSLIFKIERNKPQLYNANSTISSSNEVFLSRTEITTSETVRSYFTSWHFFHFVCNV